MNNKITKKMVSNRQKKKRLILSAFVMTLFMALFTQGAMAQTNVYMKDGNRTIQRTDAAISFYDSHGPSGAAANYWETWYNHNENFTYVFKPAVSGDKIKVTFNTFQCWAEPASGSTGVDIGNWALRLNDDYLYIYEGNGAVDANLIAELTGNTRQSFSVMTDGAITFKFVSNARYREEGWYATVELVKTDNLTAQAPLIQRSTCSDQVEIFPTTHNARIIYSIGDNDPQPGDPLAPTTYEYTGPISFPEGTIPETGFKVNAMSQLATGGTWSSVTHAVFKETDRVPFPDEDANHAHTTITREDGTNTIVMTPAWRPDGLNDTYQVRYTMSTNGTEPAEPTLNNSEVYNGPITVSVNGTIFKAKTFAVSCSNQCSATSVRYVVEGIIAPTPVIDFDAMTITAVDAAGTTFEILYTLDGSMPAEVDPEDEDHMPIGLYSATQVNLASLNLSPGQTVRAMAYRSNDDEWHTWNEEYTPSQVVSAIYIPAGGSAVYDDVVLLDDREDHTWSYYSDENSPIKKLKPADIKITYYGNSPAGRTTMTSASENGNNPTSFSAVASNVQVNVNESGNQFIYLKTLEAANENGDGGYPYTMIPNPFQKRPVLSASTTERTFVVTLSNRDTDNNWSGYGDTPATVTVSFSNGGSQVLNGPSSSTPTTPVTYTITKPVGTTVTVTFNHGDQRYPSYCVTAIAYADGETILEATNGSSSDPLLKQFTITAGSGSDATKYRGFYAWRIKSLSPGLTISGKSVGQTINADEEIVFETTKDYGNEVEFEALWAQAYVTTCSTSNGLSTAIASSTLQNNVSYERNFVVLTGGTQTSNFSNTSQKPVTISGLYPDGSGTMSSSRYLAGYFTANKNTKFENVYMQDGAASTAGYQYTYRRVYIDNYSNYYYDNGYSWTTNMNNAQTYTLTVPQANDPYDYYYSGSYLYPTSDTYNGYTIYYGFRNRTSTPLTNASAVYNANGKDLIFGRGVSPTTTGDLCIQYLKGLNSDATSPNYRIRLESGMFDIVSMVEGYNGNVSSLTISGTPKVSLVLGSDYDRANEKYTDGSMTITDKLDVKTAVAVGRSVTIGSASMMGEETFKTWVKSGKICSSHDMSNYDADFTETLYMSTHGGSTYAGYRKLFIEGGEIAGVAGGMDACYSSTTTHGTNKSLTVRMTKGHVRSAIYGGAAQVPSGGDKEIIVTGGVVTGWIGAGCNGTADSDGQTYGEGLIYFGGKAISGGNGSSNLTNNVQGGVIFGAGAGRSTSTTTGEMTFGTKVVIADECNVEHNVYGGGNYGYAVDHSNVYVLGGTVQGNVFGGANQKQGPVVNVTMKDGTVNGSVYGGSNSSGTISGLATINMSGGTVKGSVYGGGYGSSTTMSTNGTKITVTDGTIYNNIYGGGEQGIVQGATVVSFEGGSVKDIYGAGKGTEVATPGASASANVARGTTVNVKGGMVNGDVYGGGEFGTVAFASGNGTSTYNSTVSISGGEVKGDVFGGGKNGTTQGKTTVNVSGTWDGTVIRGNVFAGAYGKHEKIYVAGLKTLNISGGRIYGSIYGGSRNANDGNTINATGGTNATCITNISGGRIDQHVYAAGYYGSTKGSVYAFIGLNAINGAPNSPHSGTNATPYTLDKGSILIGGSVWAGGDWGVFTGTFGASTITGNSNIYINGEGYSTNSNDQSATNYMNIQGSILGCGTSCDAGAGERTLILSHYGADMPNSGPDSGENPFASASRQVNTIQRFHNVIFDDAHLGFLGQGKINSLNNTEKYSLYEIDQNVYLANGSTMVMNVPSSQIYSFHSVTCPDTYATSPTFTPVNYDGLGTNGGETDNKVRVNGGSYVEIKYIPEGEPNGVIPSGSDEPKEYHFDSDLEGWTAVNGDGDSYTWEYYSGSGHDNNGCVRVHWSANNHPPQDWFISPQITLGGSLSFWTKRESNTWDDSYEVYISTSGDAPANFTNNKIKDSTTPGTSWEQVEIDLSSYSGQGYVAIKYVGPANAYYLYLDDITITEPAASSGEDPQPIYYAGYGQLEGFAHMMAGNPDEDATCAYARPKQSTEEGNILVDANVFNTSDGGWVSYNEEDNEYDADGGLASETEEEGVQLRYENHYPNMRDNSEYYRIWRKGSDHHTLEAVVNAHAEGNAGVYKTVEVEVELPSWRAAGSYFRFDRTNNASDNNTLIDYGSDVMTFNGANYTDPLGAETWMYFNTTTDAQVTGVTATNTTVAAAIGANGILSNPNLNFGLVIKPGLTMKSTDVNYIINSEADTYLASVEQPFNCKDNTHKPTLKLVLTYSDELSANATLDPVLLKLVQCDAQGNITDYVTIKLIINTSMNLTSGFKTQIYARMDGSANTREISMVPVVLPTFNVATSGENAKFSLQKVEFIQNGGVVEESVHGNSVICAETRESASSSGTMLNIDRFAMTIAALPNPDNSDDWRNITGPQDAVQQPSSGYGTLVWGGSNNRGVDLGEGKGRNPLTLGITMYFNSNEEANGKSKMGDMKFTIEATNVEGGTGTNSTITFPITVEVYRLGPGDNFYVDGINGQDLDDTDRAKFPDKAAKTVNFIFNRLNYMPGDNIIVVNTLPIAKNTTWDGSRFQNNVKIYRYPGGHKLTTGGTSTETNENLPYLGPLVDVTNTLHMKGIIMDGMYAESTAPLEGVHNPKLYPTGDAGNCTFNGIAEAPLITISNGARVNLTDTQLQNNYNSKTDEGNAGGAVHVTYEGILAMNSTNRITANYNKNGGGVYVDGSMIVSDYAYVYDNYTEAVSGSKATLEQNNVMLEDVTDGTFRVVQVGTSDSNDAFDALLETGDAGETKIGVTKDDWDHAYDGYMPVVYAEAGSLSYLNDPYNTQSMVVHDDNVFKLERYVSTEYNDSPNYLYWLGTWVTAVTSEPTDFNKDQIDTPEELAWAISIVNGENGCTPAPNTSFTLTDDIDMAANIWVPIGTETSLYNGTFEGNGHVVTGLRGSITRTDMGMFGRTAANADIKDLVVSTKFNTNSDNLGTVVGNMVGGTLSNVEGAGENTSRNTAGNNGGLVGINGGGTIHSAFAVTTLKGGENIGGLVAVNNGDLLNSYSAAEMSEGTAMAGLVASNNGRVENCYNNTNAEVAFAVKNSGSIRFCYTGEVGEDETITYVGGSAEGATLEKHGTYAAPYLPHTFGYMYWDNTVTLVDEEGGSEGDKEGDEEEESYVVDEIQYAGNKISTWPGLLSSLNQWVEAKSGTTKYTHWFRPTTQFINGDLPVLGFPKANCMATASDDGKFLRYGPFDADAYSMYNAGENGGTTEDPTSADSETVGVGNQGFGQDPQQPSNTGENSNNGLDNLLQEFEEESGYVFVYDNAIDVEEVPGKNVLVFINEDVVLKQAPTAGEFINTTVGVSFDNSYKQAKDFFQNTLAYDWHMLSTPLADAPLGISYTDAEVNYWEGDNHSNQVADVQDSYLPNGTDNVGNWDLYCFYEPEYHWINLKRNSGSHYHYDENASGGHDQIIYENEETLEPGKGYLAAVNKDSYLLNKGTLNGPTNPVTVTLTKRSHDPGTEELGYNLLGNPYQAYLDMNEFINVNSSMVGNSYWVYIAEENNYIAGNAEASANPELPSATLHPHQGFFVLAQADNQKVHFNYNTMASATPDQHSYFRGHKVNYPLVNLTVSNEEGNKDLLVVEFNRPEFGGSKKVQFVNNAPFSLSSRMSDGNYSIVFTEKDTKKVPVHFKTSEDGQFTMTWQTLHGTFSSLFLVDNLTGVRTNMLTTDHYTFDGSADDYAARFYLTFNVTGVDEINDGGEDFAWFDGNEWIVTGKGQLDVIDMTGRVLQSRRVSGEQTRLHLDNVAAGVYVMRLSEGNKSKTQKIVIR